MVTISLTLVDVVFVKLLERQNIVDAKLPLNTVGMHPNNSTQIQEHDVAIKLLNRSYMATIEQIPLVFAFRENLFNKV